jgi:ribosomal subunit interface protein
MWIDVRAMGFSLTDAIREHVESRVQASLGAFAPQIRSVTVRLEDVNAGRGGVDMRCAVLVKLRGRGAGEPLVAEALEPDLYVAIDRAAARVRRPVLRQLRRPMTRERRAPHRIGSLAAAMS